MPPEATQWQQQQQEHDSATALLDHATAKESLQALHLSSLQQVLKVSTLGLSRVFAWRSAPRKLLQLATEVAGSTLRQCVMHWEHVEFLL